MRFERCRMLFGDEDFEKLQKAKIIILGVGGVGSYALLSKRSPNRYHLMRILRKRNMQVHGELISTLLEDSTPASSASVTVAQVDAVADPSANVQRWCSWCYF